MGRAHVKFWLRGFERWVYAFVINKLRIYSTLTSTRLQAKNLFYSFLYAALFYQRAKDPRRKSCQRNDIYTHRSSSPFNLSSTVVWSSKRLVKNPKKTPFHYHTIKRRGSSAAASRSGPLSYERNAEHRGGYDTIFVFLLVYIYCLWPPVADLEKY